MHLVRFTIEVYKFPSLKNPKTIITSINIYIGFYRRLRFSKLILNTPFFKSGHHT